MKWQKLRSSQRLLLGALALCGIAVGCKDDEPCDPGQIVQNTQCYPAPATGGDSAAGGGDAGGGSDAASGAPGSAAETPFGTACKDVTASSDCGRPAPICADLTQLGQSVMCTQIDCSEGEANAGACPSGFSCFAFPGYPSVCTRG